MNGMAFFFFSCALHTANQATGGAAGTVSSGNAFIGGLYLLMCLGSWAADRKSNREAVVHLSGRAPPSLAAKLPNSHFYIYI